tara:strand:- start:142 stop:381 length:240 start_codon:yes stop_codon:yes gene_type:complete
LKSEIPFESRRVAECLWRSGRVDERGNKMMMKMSEERRRKYRSRMRKKHCYDLRAESAWYSIKEKSLHSPILLHRQSSG